MALNTCGQITAVFGTTALLLVWYCLNIVLRIGYKSAIWLLQWQWVADEKVRVVVYAAVERKLCLCGSGKNDINGAFSSGTGNRWSWKMRFFSAALTCSPRPPPPPFPLILSLLFLLLLSLCSLPFFPLSSHMILQRCKIQRTQKSSPTLDCFIHANRGEKMCAEGEEKTENEERG